MRAFNFIVIMLCACGENLTHPDATGLPASDAEALSCLPNLDGRLEADEAPVAFGVPASFLVSSVAGRAVDVAGALDSAGHRVWDWSAPAVDDRAVEMTATRLAGRWYAESFPDGDFVLPLDAAGALEAVYAVDDGALRLLGMASATAEPAEGKTLLVYTAAIDVLRFPLEVGTSFSSSGAIVGGTFHGLPYAGEDTYEIDDDATGRLVLPDLTFTQAHRVRTRVTVRPVVGVATSRRQVAFMFECFGEVARATSANGEPADDFVTAAEVRRLGL